MSPRTLLAACAAAAFLAFAPPALAVGTSAVTTPADGSAFAYRDAAAPTVAVSGTATGMASVDLRCADRYAGGWEWGSPLPGGSDVPVSGGAFSAPSVTLSTSDNPLCRLVAVPHGTTPSDLSGLSGPDLRLLIVHDSGPGNTDNNGGGDQGLPYDYYASAGGTAADSGIVSAGDWGLDFMNLLSSDPGELAVVFSGTATESDTIVSCVGADPMWYQPQGATCTGLVDSGVSLSVATTISPGGNVVDRRWSLASTDGRPHQVVLWIEHAAGRNGMRRQWKLPGDADYAERNGGDTPAVSGGTPWVARFDSVGAADGDTSEGVGAVGASVAPDAVQFADARELDTKYTVAVPATGTAQLRFVYVGDATHAALESDLTAAFPPIGGGGGGGGNGGGGNGSSVLAPVLARTAKAVLGTNGTLALGYTLSCPTPDASSCSVSVALTQPVRAKRHAKRKPGPRTLATLKATVAAGSVKALSVKIARKNRAFFKAGHITMTALLSRPGVATKSVANPLPVRIAKPKPRRHRR